MSCSRQTPLARYPSSGTIFELSNRVLTIGLLLLACLAPAGLGAAPAVRPAARKPAPVVRKAPAKKSTRTVATRRAPVRRTAAASRWSAAAARNRAYYNYRRYLRPVAHVAADGVLGMGVPVEGLRLSELQDSFYHRRGDGRTHYAIDIMRPIGDPLLAVVDGTIEQMRMNPLGGITVTIVDTERKLRFYYAHLSRYADGLVEGQAVQRGDLLGFVGDTGNARGTTPHLHFQIGNMGGAAVNPYPLLVHAVRNQVPAVPVESVSLGGAGLEE